MDVFIKKSRLTNANRGLHSPFKKRFMFFDFSYQTIILHDLIRTIVTMLLPPYTSSDAKELSMIPGKSVFTEVLVTWSDFDLPEPDDDVFHFR